MTNQEQFETIYDRLKKVRLEKITAKTILLKNLDLLKRLIQK